MAKANEDLKQEIENLKKKNDTLTRENKYLKDLTSSKRFKFAEKIATTYNVFLPVSTKRRLAIEKIGRRIKNVSSRKKKNREAKTTKRIAKLTEGNDKIMVINGIPFDTKLKQRPQHLAYEFSKLGFFVIYLEYDNPVKLFRTIDKQIITVNTERLILDLPKHHRDCYFLTPNNIQTSLSTLEKVKASGYKLIYDYLDEFHEEISGNLSIQREVWDNLRNLDPALCLATAKRLYDDIRAHLGNKQKIIMAKNAVVAEHFDPDNIPDKTPADLKPIVRKGKPIIGYYGALAPWTDYNLLNNIAKKHQEWEFVYLGIDYNNTAKSLKPGDNVHNLGAKNYEELPSYAKYFDCATIPFKKGEIAKATSPVKLFEYMAAGLPTVCTRDLIECEGFDYVYMSKTDKDFEENIKKAIKDRGDAKATETLIKQAKANTWSARAQAIVEALDTK